MVQGIFKPFSRPIRQIFIMLVVFGLIMFGIAVIAPGLAPVFLSSPYLNGFIIFVFFIGVIACFWQMLELNGSVGWINAYSNDIPVKSTPRLLKPLAVLMRGDRLPDGISTASAQTILDSVATRLDESRDITRYIINTLIFLGLLGTFYGLATTIPAVVDTIRTLRPEEGTDAVASFDNLMSGLENQLGGMGTAFASSLLGLSGSLIVGLLELFAGHGQNRFYREFEEWLSSFTAVGMAESAPRDNGKTKSIPEIYPGMTTDAALSSVMKNLALALGNIDQRLDQQTAVLAGLKEALLTANSQADDAQKMRADSRQVLRDIEETLVRLNEDMAVGRDKTIAELRRDIMEVNRTIIYATKDEQ